MREATASYTILATDDTDALNKIRAIIKNREVISEADDFSDIDGPFNFSGNFTLARGGHVPDDEDDKSIVALREEFGDSF
jgi:hypothetical protein